MPRPKNWKSLAPFPASPPPNGTYAHQPALPQLPLPSFERTLARLKETLKPMARNEEEYAAAVAKIDDFGKEGADGLGRKLYERLEERKKGRDHWLEEWWDDLAYMDYRDSVVVNVSYFYGFSPTPLPSPLAPTLPNRAAALTRSTLLLRNTLLNGFLTPDTIKSKPICMDTWRWMFDCARVPEFPDYSVSYTSENLNAERGEGVSVIAVHKGRFWKIRGADKEGNVLSTQDLSQAFLSILRAPPIDPPAPEVGILTSLPRDDWANAYRLLSSSRHNQDILKEIHRSAFVVCLDDQIPKNVEEFSWALWCGGRPENGKNFQLYNRWCDKPIQYILFPHPHELSNNFSPDSPPPSVPQFGEGLMGEHSIMDGTPVTRVCTEVLTALRDPAFEHGLPSSSSSPSSPDPKPLDWDTALSSPLSTHLSLAHEKASALVSSQSLTYTLTHPGAALPKRNGISPDSWVQLLIQLAFSRLGIQRDGGTYEAATTRKFLRGRTETVRVVSSESDAFCAAMNSPSSTTPEERVALLRKAADTHIRRAKEAGDASGVDRTLLGLKLLLDKKADESHAMFSDPLYVRASNWQLSTSAIFSPYFPAYGWGEVVQDGFGVAYMTGYSDRFQFTITSRTHMPNERFIEEIKRAAEDMKLLVEPEGEKRKSML